jgi:hypothetical protein
MHRISNLFPLVLAVAVGVASPIEAAGPAKKSARPAPRKLLPEPTPDPISSNEIDWSGDYGDAMQRAELGHKMLLVYFYNPDGSANQNRFERESLADAEAVKTLKTDYIAVRVPLDYTVSIGGEQTVLLSHSSFKELHNRAGLAIIDFLHDTEDLNGNVVSVLPLDNGKYYRFDPQHLATLLQLPAGTLTQRTMIFAVRVHPENPKSTTGAPDNTLFDEAREHSHHQARIRNQGHHNWGQRFARIIGRLPGGLLAKEVVAESWPNEGLVDACVDCVDSWRQSSGHWGAVRNTQQRYGYDIKKGSNGIWYATGIFGDHRQ